MHLTRFSIAVTATISSANAVSEISGQLSGATGPTVDLTSINVASLCEDVLYYLNNNPEQCALVSVCATKQGTLEAYTFTTTGGNGMLSFANGAIPIAGPDTLHSQGAVAVYEDMLFTVNPGSNTVVMFDLSNNPMAPVMVGHPASSLGEFPVSVTYSAGLNMLCVVNGGAVAGVACYHVDAEKGLKALDKTLRPLPSPFNQTTPPTGAQTVSDIQFTPDNAYVVVTVKGNNPQPGMVLSWAVSAGVVVRGSVSSSFPGDFTPFGFGFLGTTKDYSLLVSDPSVGSYVLSLAGSSGGFTKKADVAGTKSFRAACWGTNNPSMNYGFIMDAAVPEVGIIRAGSLDTTIATLPLGSNGAFDAVASSSKLYILAASAGIAIIEYKNPTKVQYLNLTQIGQRSTWQGIARYNM